MSTSLTVLHFRYVFLDSILLEDGFAPDDQILQ